jgi:hypothetical protein
MFFNHHFLGGLYSISVEQSLSGLSINYDLLCIAESSNLHRHIEADLLRRVKKIIVSAEVSLLVPQKLNSVYILQKKIHELEDKSTCFIADSLLLQKLNKYLMRWIQQAIASDIKTFGTLYKMVHLT